jgi:hypothetical protein
VAPDLNGRSDGHAAGGPQVGTIEDHRACCDEDVVGEQGATDIGVGSEENFATQPGGMPRGTSQHCMFHDDAAWAHLDGSAFARKHGAKEDSRLGSDVNIA